VIEAARTSAIVGLVLAGLFFTFVSATGVLRLPDIYSRAHTASQADTLGAGFTLAGVALALGWSTTTAKTVLLLFFIFLTNPTAAHAISRAAHEEGVEPWTTDDDRTDEDLHEASRRRPTPDPTPADRVADGGAPDRAAGDDPTDGHATGAADTGTADTAGGDADRSPDSETDPSPDSDAAGSTGSNEDGSTDPAGGDRR
jgi:multicomponent Na+:H+ antiporter subunit G